MSLPTVEAARAVMLDAIGAVGQASEQVPLGEADGRWLSGSVRASRDQPPFDASAMDGWAVRTADVAQGARLAIVGESAAGGSGDLEIGPGQATRIFTGAPLPRGADGIVIQELARRDGDVVVLETEAPDPAHVRPRAGDFAAKAVLLEPGLRLTPWRIALAASAGVASVGCAPRPRVAILANGDELVEPGEVAGDHQIYNAGGPALAVFVRRHGGLAQPLRIAGDTQADILDAVSRAEFDLLVVIGGASVGDHDQVKPALRSFGAELLVEGCAVRPGKPVWFARLGEGRFVLGLPGNPASALVCAELFLGPLLASLQGGRADAAFERAILDAPLEANGPRDHYLRAEVVTDEEGRRRVRPFANQDSSLVTVLAGASVLVRRPPSAPPAARGDDVMVLSPTA
jgi:molybdopterin molybdotransferase